jgi:polyvinyl alcohol dehydrogenase (cytochrome)
MRVGPELRAIFERCWPWLPALIAAACASRPASEPALPADATPEQRGALVYTEHCAKCHDGQVARAPWRTALHYRTPNAIVRALRTGTMREQGSKLALEEQELVAHFLTGLPVVAEPEPLPNRCAFPAPPVAIGSGDWPLLGGNSANSRLQPRPGLSARDLGKLELAWAFAAPSGASGGATYASGRVFLASGSGEVFALDAKTGCAHWVHADAGLVRNVSLGTPEDGRTRVFYGDGRGNVTALDAQSGEKLWTRAVEEHPLAKITAAPTHHQGRIYVPMSSIEDPLMHDPAYACCTFRGSVSALDARTGKKIWKTYTIEEEPARLPRASDAPPGPERYAPAGGAIWTPLTIDARRGVVYAATGESYDDGNPRDAHSIVAYDLATGDRRWARSFKPPEQAETCRGSEVSDCRNAFEFGASVVLHTLASGKDVLLAAQKSGYAYALDPDAEGRVLWSTRVSQGGDMGGTMYGLAVEGDTAFFPASDLYTPRPGGLVAVDVRSGEKRWSIPAPDAVCSWGTVGCSSASIAAATAIPGAVFQGTDDGHLRAYSTRDGSLLFDFDSGRSFEAVNGIAAIGGNAGGYPVLPAGGTLFIVSGANTNRRTGNALLALRPREN